MPFFDGIALIAVEFLGDLLKLLLGQGVFENSFKSRQIKEIDVNPAHVPFLVLSYYRIAGYLWMVLKVLKPHHRDKRLVVQDEAFHVDYLTFTVLPSHHDESLLQLICVRP